MNELEFRRKSLIKDLVNNPLFKDIMQDIKKEAGVKILNEPSREKREELYYQAQALESLYSELTRIANEVKAISHGNE